MFKKIVPVFLILAIIFSPFFTASAAGDPLTAYGYEVTVWKYSGSGSPQQVGKPILIYHPDLLGTVYKVTDGDLPNSYNEFVSSNWGFNQIIDFENDTWEGSKNEIELMPGIQSNPNVGSVDQATDRFGNLIPYSPGALYFNWTVCNPQYEIKDVRERTEGKMEYNIYTQSYGTRARRKYYTKDYITNLSDYYKTYSDSNLTEDQIKNNGYLDEIIKGVYFANVQSVKTYFGIDIDYSEIDEYYVSVEPVLRILDTKEKRYASYHIKDVEQDPYPKEADEWTINDWTSTYHPDTKNCSCGTKNCKSCKTYDEEDKKKCIEWYMKDCNNCNCNNSYYTYSLPKQECGERVIQKFYGYYAYGYSHIATAREVGASSIYLNRAVNYCDNQDNAHCVLEDDMVTCKKDSSGNKIYQYYVGPNLEKALVGTTSNNYYLLNGSCTNGVSGRKETGIKHYYLENLINCSNVCGGLSGDTLLACAENYCDAEVNFDLEGNARIRKKNCILKSCGYKYGKVPEGGKYPDDLESKNSCNNANPYKGKEKLLLGSNSDCNKNVASGNLMQKEKGVTVSCKGDRVTDFDNDDTNDTIFDQRTYINTACMEKTSFEYEDLKTENTDLKPGSPINYYVNQEGERKCTYFFNLEQWKFDYASIPSKDLDRRKRLKYIYTTFNHAYDKSYDPKTNGAVYDKDFEDNNDGTIEVQKYDIEKTQVMSRVKEIIENKPKTSETELLIRQDEKENTVYNTTKKEKIYSFENIDKYEAEVSRYESISTSVATYRYNKRCLTTDGEAKVYTPEGDICHTTKTGEDKLAKYAYYTNLKATYDKDFSKPDYEHKVYTTATVGIESSSGNLYYSNNESCKYTLDKPEQGPGCIIKITQEAGTDLLGNNVYEGGAVKAKVVVLNEEGLEKTDRIGRIELTVNGVTEVAEEKIIPIGEAGDNDSRKDYKIVGKVTTKNGLVSTCEKEIILLKHSNCGATCSVNKINGKLYEIVGVSANSILKSTILNMERTSVAKTINEEKYYVTAPEEIKENDMIIGYVVNGNCNEYCYYPLEKPTGQSCTSLYKPAELGNIIAYCNANYRTDLNNYKSTDECIKDCSNACPNECRNEKDLQKYCENPERLGFESENECLNRCYCPYSEDGYLFRSIHNHDPFPNSPNSPYAKGNRGIGKNWYAREEYIIDDSNDETSVTGDYANQQVEYIMALDIDDIKMIRNENNNDGKEAYTKLIYSSQTEDDNYVGEYKSKLLNDTLAGEDIFINAMNGKKAKYVPG